MIIVGLGVLLFLVPIARIKQYDNAHFRLLMLVSILLWTVIFNHEAESPTFRFAFAGISIWFFASNQSRINMILFVLAFVFTTLSPTDLFPRFLQNDYVEPFQLKVLPCILVWIKVLYDMMVMERPVSLGKSIK